MDAHGDGYGPMAVGPRAALAVALGLGWAAILGALGGVPWREAGPLGLVAHPVARLGLTALAAVLLLTWTRSGRPGPALGLLLVAALGAWADAARTGAGEHHARLLPFVALAGWLGGARLAPGRGAVDGAWGAVGAAYVASAVAKLAAAGPAWADGATVSLLLAERAGPDALGALRATLAATPGLAGALATGALVIEGAGVLTLWPAARRGWAAAAAAMHLGIAGMLGYVYLPWLATLAALVWVDRADRPPDAR